MYIYHFFIKVWELQNAKSFVYNDMPYLDHLQQQKDEYEQEEMEKKRQKQVWYPCFVAIAIIGCAIY